MACDEFVLDLSEFFQEPSELMLSSSEKEGKPGWVKEKGRFLCLVDGCRKKKLSFDQRYGLLRHWEEIHCQEITLFKCTRQSSCRTFKQPYDLERHLVKMHNMEEAKAHSTSGVVKTKTVQNLNYVDPGRLQPPKRKASVPGTGNPLSETVPGVTVPAYKELKRLKVNFQNEMDCSEVEVVLYGKPSEGSGEPTIPDGTTQSTSVSMVTNAPPLPIPAVANMPSTSVSLGTDTPSLPESAIADMPSLPCTSVPSVTDIPSLSESAVAVMPSTPVSTVMDIAPMPVSHDPTKETAMLLSTTDELYTGNNKRLLHHFNFYSSASIQTGRGKRVK